MKPTVLSGIQPTGPLHIGNYLGALRNFVELQNSAKFNCLFMIADLHSLTENFDPKNKAHQVMDVAASFLAAGLDPKKSILFTQSQIPAHTELSWILSSITPMGELKRMTQYKDKAGIEEKLSTDLERIKKNKDLYEKFQKIFSDFQALDHSANEHRNLEKMHEKRFFDVLQPSIELLKFTAEKEAASSVGLFTYPILMACDIILYNASVVPTGDDQDQHLELTRTIARKFNTRFGETFTEPKNLHTALPRVMSLSHPEKKMSKSEPAGCLFIDDAPEVINKKIMSAVTDSGDEVKFDDAKKPGISNLLRIMSAISGKTIPTLEAEFAGKNYGQFKNTLALQTINYLAPMREKKIALLKSPAKVHKAFADGNKKAKKIASAKIAEVYKKIGLI